MRVSNHNGAHYGDVKLNDYGTPYFFPKKGWTYTAHQLEEIAKLMREIEK